MNELMKNERKKGREGKERNKVYLTYDLEITILDRAPFGPTFGKDGRWQRTKKHILVCTPPARRQDRPGSHNRLPEYSSNG